MICDMTYEGLYIYSLESRHHTNSTISTLSLQYTLPHSTSPHYDPTSA
jgi:hypothetical protein